MTFSCSDELKVISSTESYPDFIEITVKEIKETLDWARNQLIVNSLGSQQLTSKLDSLENELINLVNYSNYYNFADTPVNGFSAFADFFLQFFRHLYQVNYFTSIKVTDDFETMIDLFLCDIELSRNFHFEQLAAANNNNRRLSLHSEDETLVRKAFMLHQTDSKSIETMIVHFNSFWSNQVAKKYAKLITPAYAFFYSSFLNCIKAFTDEKFSRLACYRAQASSFSLLLPQLCDTHTNRILLRFLSRDSQVKVKTFDFMRQTEWTVADKGKNVFKSETPETDKCPLNFKLIQNKNCDNSDGTLIFYCHGGGFVFMRSETHELYLKKFARELKDVPILCLDYSLRTPNPILFQEFLDAYLWLTSGSSDVVDKIGFHPKRIIISGDSAGGTIGLALIHCLSMVEDKDPSMSILYPSDMVFFYGAFACSELALPSRLKLFYDEVLGAGLLCNISGCLSNTAGAVLPKPRSSNPFMRAVNGTYEDFKVLISVLKKQTPTAWFITDGKYDVDKVLISQNLISDTFYNSTKNFCYNRFDKIRLTLLTTNRCVFLDDNVELAKSWKGPVEMHTVAGLMHGFLVIPEEKKAFQFAVELLKKTLSSHV